MNSLVEEKDSPFRWTRRAPAGSIVRRTGQGYCEGLRKTFVRQAGSKRTDGANRKIVDENHAWKR
jgi:hypothetical protein